MQLNLIKNITTIFGLNLSGKSFLVKNAILPRYRCIVWDPNQEYDVNKCDVYYPKNLAYPGSANEMETFLSKYVKAGKGKYDLVVIDEANGPFPVNRPLLGVATDFLNTYRHDKWGNLGMLLICRRPAQLYTDFSELSHVLITFGSNGKNDISRLNSIYTGMGDAAAQLEQYHYIICLNGREWHKMKPWKP